MSERDDFAAFIERVAADLGVPVKCRKMHREAFEWDGEWFPARDEYELRRIHKPGEVYRVWTFDVELADMERDAAREVIAWELEPR